MIKLTAYPVDENDLGMLQYAPETFESLAPGRWLCTNGDIVGRGNSGREAEKDFDKQAEAYRRQWNITKDYKKLWIKGKLAASIYRMT